MCPLSYDYFLDACAGATHRTLKIFQRSFCYTFSCCQWSHVLRPKKKLSVSVAVLPAPIRVPSQRPLAPSVASITPGGNEMILGAVYRSPAICLTAEENPRKPQLGDSLMNSHRLKCGPYSPNEVGRIGQHIRKREGRKEGTDRKPIKLSQSL